MKTFYIIGIVGMIGNILIAAEEKNPHSAGGWIVAMLFFDCVTFRRIEKR